MSILSLLPVIEGGASRKMGDVTWNLDEMSGTKISGLDSLCQAIRVMLEVPRYRYPIYSWQYGSELDTLIGSGFSDVQQKAPTMIRDALLRDDRIDEGRQLHRLPYPAAGRDGYHIYCPFTARQYRGVLDG